MEHWITLLGRPGPCPISWWLPWVILRVPPLPASLLYLIPSVCSSQWGTDPGESFPFQGEDSRLSQSSVKQKITGDYRPGLEPCGKSVISEIGLALG